MIEMNEEMFLNFIIYKILYILYIFSISLKFFI